jgi:RNA polymerase sigma-70 factor (ECF subfamily)
MTNASVTLLLSRAQQGDVFAEHEVMPLVYARLKTIAQVLMRRERQGHTLRATALVSELFIQKLRRIKTPLSDREHFFSLAANAMRQVLIDHARHRSASRRLAPESVADLLALADQPTLPVEDRLAVRQVFRALNKIDRAAAESIHCRFIDGMTIAETAARFHRPVWKVRDDCDFGLRWMGRRLGKSIT